MKTHRFDALSALFGIVTIVVGMIAVNSRLGNLINDRPDALLPMLVLAAGLVAVIVAARRSLQDVHGASDDQHDRAE